MAEGEGPLVWSFVSDAPGTMWGAVTWKLSTEAEWHMCGGREGSATIEPMPAGTYWVEIADEVDMSFAGAALDLQPFDRCSQPHVPTLGPLHPVELAAVTVVPPVVVSPAAESVTASGNAATATSADCDADRELRRQLRAAVRADLRALHGTTTRAGRASWRRRLAAHRAFLRSIICR